MISPSPEKKLLTKPQNCKQVQFESIDRWQLKCGSNDRIFVRFGEVPNEPSCSYVRDTAISSVHFRDMHIDVIAMFCLQMN